MMSTKVPAVRNRTSVSVPPVAAPPAYSPPPAAAPPQTPLPPDAGYEQTVAALGQRRDSTIAGLGQQRQQGLLGYGYTEDPTGALGFDPANPFSQAAVLKRNYDQSRAGNTTSYAGRGQLYAGSLQTAQDTTNRGEMQASDVLQKQAGAFLARNTQNRFKAGSDYEMGVGQALSDSIARAASNPAYETVTAPPDAPPAAASPAARAAVAKTKAKPKPKAKPAMSTKRLTGRR